MKNSILFLTMLLTVVASCNSNRNLTAIQPKQGTISIPAKGELALWKNIKHNGFSVAFTNNNPKASCEIYRVNKNGFEKWINPSLLANSKIAVAVANDGYVFFKNFNDTPLTISYLIEN
jgi:hypothetical protein